MDKGGEVYLPFPTGLVSLHGGHTILHFLEGGDKNAVSASRSIDQLLRSSMNCPPPPPTYPVHFHIQSHLHGRQCYFCKS